MAGYCKTTGCLRGAILDYFGQAHAERCGYCGNCRARFAQTDVTREAQIILSCVKRVRDRLGYSVGATLLVHTLCGSTERRVRELGLDRLSTYGLLKSVSRAQVKEYLELLETEGYLRTSAAHGGIELTEKAGDVLFRGAPVVMRKREQPVQEPKRSKKRPAADAEADSELFAALKTLRFQIAQRENVPAYIIFSNAALADMAAKTPQNMEEFLEVSGVGAVKAARYGAAFLDRIAQFTNGE